MTEKRVLEPNDLYRLHLISDPQIAPDGSRVAFVLKQMDEEKNEYISNIYVVDRDGTLTQFTSGDKDSAPRWSPDGKYLAFLSGRKEKAQIHLMPTGGGESIAMTDRKLGAGVPFWSPDSTAIAFVGAVSTTPEEDEEDGKNGKDGDKKKKAPTKIIERSSYKLDGAGFIWNRRRHLFLIDVAQRTVQQLTEGDYHNDNPAWAPDSQSLAFDTNRSPLWDISVESEIWVMPRSGGQARKITDRGSYSNPAFSPDGSRIAFIGREDPEEAFMPSHLFSIDQSGSGLRDEQGGWDGQMGNDVGSDVVRSEGTGLGLTWREDGIYFLGTVRGECNVFRASDSAVTSITSGRHTITDFSVARDGAMAYTCSDVSHLPEVFLRSGDETQQLTHQNDAFLSEVHVAQPERFCFVGANGEESEGWLLPPHGHESGRHPLIAYIHGGPATAHGEAFFFEYQYLAGQGFGVFSPNIHGSSSYGEAYQTSIQRDWGNLDYQDVLAGVDAAASRDWVDQERLGIAGGSYGGYMTNWVMTHTDRFKAGVTERCLSNMISFMGTTDFGWLWNRVWGFYPEENVEKLWDMSPIKYADKVQGALMVIHSERDDRCPVEQGEQMFNALRRLGKETKMIIFPEESHGLTRMGTPSRRVERLGYITDWFRRHL